MKKLLPLLLLTGVLAFYGWQYAGARANTKALEAIAGADNAIELSISGMT